MPGFEVPDGSTLRIRRLIRGLRFKRDFGVPEDSAQTHFTDPQSWNMKQPDAGFEHNCRA
ncbi:MAG: hypothetical protein JNN30_14685 [Rhodanobacteraceae bacterium]|nr:hypothetical protein [Rhodanobacteraceae bacterium]